MTLLTPTIVELLRSAPMCQIATLLPDGSPHLTQTWIDTDDTRVLINTVVGYRKVANIERDPRIALTIQMPSNPSLYIALRGIVSAQTTTGAKDHIEMLAHRYLGGPYPYGGPGQQRLLLTVTVTHLLHSPFPNKDRP
jgi:PPOX class probable F420-dependent enzyme